MPRTPSQNKIIRDARRAKLLSHALRVFAVRGYDDATIDDITKAAKCSHGLFYHYFKSKPIVFRAVLDEIILKSSSLPPVKEALDAGGIQGIRVFGNYAERVMKASEKDYYVLRIVSSADEQETLSAEDRKAMDAYNPVPALVTMVKEGQQADAVISGDPDEIALAFRDMIIEGIRRKGKEGARAKVVSSDVLVNMLSKRPQN